ncbi:MAG: transglycosylase SLT domain-containing protein [Alphaproteobacteria bacterium]|nr:transglycosylase SLT domain-containing protein [Alphaproteobacteria bacterium]
MSRLPILLTPIFCLALGVAPACAASHHHPHHASHHRAATRKPESQAELYRRAFAAIDANNPQLAESIAAHGRDPLLTKIVRGEAMALPGNDYSFEELNAFIAGNPGWPGLKGIQMIAEQKMPADAVPSQVVAWYAARPPVTLTGFYRYVDALNKSGMAQTAIDAIRDRWVNGDFSGDDLIAFYSRFSPLLPPGAMWARMDRLLWKNDESGARRMMPWLDATNRAVAQARLALAQNDDAEAWLDRVPPDARNDPGLLYQKLRWLIKRNDDNDADAILMNPPPEPDNAKAWWEQRQIEVRRAIAAHDFTLAYQLASANGQSAGKPLAQAEFLSGWLALRFLNKPDVALQHFQTLYDNAFTPISRARGAYWLGRSYEAMGDRNEAEQAYENAAALDTTYYGQLATARLYATPVLVAKSDPPLPDVARHAIMSRDPIRAIVDLNNIGQTDRARTFFHAAVDAAQRRAEFVVLAEIAQQIGQPDLGIQAVKAAAQKNMLIFNGGYPLLRMRAPSPPEPALTHALIRQESQFNPRVSSGVGARGLMQLMPRTAHDVARQLGMRYSESRLVEPPYNLRLGTAFVQQQIDHFNGSYILALAGYNAGPARVREWIQTYGDPRQPGIDPIDWVELIPIQETRNYVERIIENLQIYRAKLAGGQAPLLILNDLKR